MTDNCNHTDGIDHEHLTLDDRLTSGLHHTAGDGKAGRDLTTFGSPETFEQVLADLDLPSDPIELYDDLDRRRCFVWANDELMIVTGANPITGEHAHYDQNELGYASYIGIEGDEDAVRTADDVIRWAIESDPNAYTDGGVESGSRGFI
jgi:hypothetical protein